METGPGPLDRGTSRRGRRGQGDVAEDRCARWLGTRGWNVLDRGWTCRQGELDIVARDPIGELVFLEVKSGTSALEPGEQITTTKQRRLCRAAVAWLVAHDLWGESARFDLLLVRGDAPPEHIQDAFHFVE
ncbi:MAG: YraN family protein [Fibrobacteria bacterium]|nr:YraN family protein [Fibrobacteria bacterium]